MLQRVNLGRWRHAVKVFRTLVRGGVHYRTLAAVAALAVAGAGSPADAIEGVSPDALLARGIAHFGGSEMRLGLDELREAANSRPDHPLTRSSLAIALLRAGLFEEAEREFSRTLGEGLAGALAEGRVSHDAVRTDVDPETVLGLATAVHLQGGRPRQAERLYRAYAELVGPLSREAGTAYKRLSELADTEKVDWLDADAELAKAEAVEPHLASLEMLPGFVDPHSIPELEPYVRPIELSPARVDTSLELTELPALSRWAVPGDTTASLVAVAEGALQLEILVGADGAAVEVGSVPDIGAADLEPVRSAAALWRFSPAVSDGEPLEAWILFGSESSGDWSSAPEEGEDKAPAAERASPEPADLPETN